MTNFPQLIQNETRMKDFRQLKVWEKSHELALAVYHITAAFPREETYGLTSQIRRAASSIPSNIAEGCGLDRSSSRSGAQLLILNGKPSQSVGRYWLQADIQQLESLLL